MKKKVIIIDDDINSVTLLKHYLASHTLQLELAGTAYNCKDGIQLIRNTMPDLVLLDVEMPDGSGFDVLCSVQDLSFYTVFITAFDRFAVPAFDAGALHFLCKPVGKEKFDVAVLRFYERYGCLAEDNKSIVPPADSITEQKLKIPRLYGYDIVDANDIVRLEANGSYTKIYFSSGENTLVSRHLKSYEEALHPLGFIRIQKSHLVNVSYIKSIHKGKKGMLVLKDNTHLYFSNTYREEILHYFLA